MVLSPPADAMTDTSESKLPAGFVVKDRYLIVRPLGAGGMGAVYEARDRVLEKRVALKILHATVARDPQTHARFLQEARAASALDHPNVVKSLDFGEHDGAPFLVMDFLEGESFAALLAREGPLSPVRALSLLEPVARAVERAHRAGIIHRDIKPDNVFLACGEADDACVPKLVDFGLARRTHDAQPRLTGTAATMGTPFYMPPEQAMGARDATAAADQYAFAVMLYESLTGRFPHEGDTYNALIVGKVTRDPQPLQALLPALPRALHDAVMRALAREPAERFPTMEALREALVAAVGQPLPAPARGRGHGPPGVAQGPQGAFDDTLAPTPSTTPAPRGLITSEGGIERSLSATPPTARGGLRSRRSAFVAGVLALLVTAGVAVLWRLGDPGGRATAVTIPRHPDGRTGYAVTREPESPRRTLRIRVLPATATITADGVVVGTGAATLQVDSGRAVDLRFEAPEHLPRAEVLRADTDQSIERVLAPAPAAASPAADAAVAAAPPAVPAAPRAARPQHRVPGHVEHRLRRTGVVLDQSIPGS
jgi:serine/threonine protein kinase